MLLYLVYEQPKAIFCYIFFQVTQLKNYDGTILQNEFAFLQVYLQHRKINLNEEYR